MTDDTKKKKGVEAPDGGEEVVTMRKADIEAMIQKAIADNKLEEVKPLRPKRVKEHMAHVWRLDGRWIVDFVDQNIDKATGKKIDEYRTEKLHSWQKFNEQRREFESWIEVVFEPSEDPEAPKTKIIPLTTYLKNRLHVYCLIVKRDQKDLSYSIGMVEKKKENADGMLVGTGVMIEQMVELYEETFTIKVPEGKELVIPGYALA